MPHYYPVFLNLSGQSCLVVGGGSVGTRKAASLVDSGATVIVVSPSMSAELEALERGGSLRLIREPYSPEHIKGMRLLFAATDLRAVNARVVADAHAASILANSADAPEEGDFIVPATVHRGELCIAISTGSASPKLAARIRRELEDRFPETYGDYIELLGRMRSHIKLQTTDIDKRSRALAALLDHEAALRRIIEASGVDAAMNEAMRLAERAME